MLDLVKVEKISRLTKGKEVTSEALVQFNNQGIRDTLSSYGPSLAGKKATMRMVIPKGLKEEERELEKIAWKIRSMKNGMKTRLRFDDAAQGLKLMVKSPGQSKKWKQATKLLVDDAEKHVAKYGGKKRNRSDSTSPSQHYVPQGRRNPQAPAEKMQRK